MLHRGRKLGKTSLVLTALEGLRDRIVVEVVYAPIRHAGKKRFGSIMVKDHLDEKNIHPLRSGCQ
jgi:hypothetical protein